MAEAEAARDRGEVPVGAVVVDGSTGAVLARAGNGVEAGATRRRTPRCLPFAPPRPNGARRGSSTATSTSRWNPAPCVPKQSPSPGCGGSTFGAADPKGGGVEHGARVFQQPTCHHRPEVIGGIQESRAAQLLRRFFEARR